MAYINLAGGLKINTADAVDSRLILTKAEMKSLHYANDESRPATLRGKIFQLPSNYLCVCSEDNTIYVYNALNEEDELTGKFKKVESDGGGGAFFDISPYLNTENFILNITTISQEGYNLLFDGLNNKKYNGVQTENYYYSLIKIDNGTAIFGNMYARNKQYSTLKINKDLSVEYVENKKIISILSDQLIMNGLNDISWANDNIKQLYLQYFNSSGSANNYDFSIDGLYNLTYVEGFWELKFVNQVFYYNLFGDTLKWEVLAIDTILTATNGEFVFPTSQVIPSITTSGTQENITIGDGLKIENGALKTTSSGSSKVWYELPNLLLLENITQEQFNEIKNLASQNQLAGINCGGFCCPLTFYQDEQSISFFFPWYENDIFTPHLIRLDTDLSVKKIPYSTITLPQTAPSSQVIPSITTSNTQQNLTIGDGLAIENEALKTNKYLAIDNYITITSSTRGTISQDGLNLINEKLLENKIYEGVSFQGLEFAFYQYLLWDSCIFYGIVDSAQMKLDVDMATGNYTATPVTDIQIGTFGPYLPPTPKNVTSKLYFVGLNNGELQWVQYTADDTLSNRVDNLEGRVSSLENEVSQYSGSISSLESRVSSLETASTSYAQASDVSTLDSRVSDIETTVASKSEVSVSSTGTATDTISYITVDGVEKKIDGGSGGGGTTLYKHELMFADNNHDGDKVHLTIIKNVATPITKFAYSQLIANMVGCYGYKAEKEYPFMSVIGIVSTGTTVPTDERTYIALMQPASGEIGQAMVLADTAATDTVTEL